MVKAADLRRRETANQAAHDACDALKSAIQWCARAACISTLWLPCSLATAGAGFPALCATGSLDPFLLLNAVQEALDELAESLDAGANGGSEVAGITYRIPVLELAAGGAFPSKAKAAAHMAECKKMAASRFGGDADGR